MNINNIAPQAAFAVAALIISLSGVDLLAGCESTGGNDTNTRDHPTGQGSCH
jgi:hypothetical protein